MSVSGACFCTGACMAPGGRCPAMPVEYPVPEKKVNTETTGWICPKCMSSIAPWISTCPKCEAFKDPFVLKFTN